MRAVLLIMILGVVILIGLVATGLLNINQTRPAEAPQVRATSNGITAKGGQPPAFDVETGTVSVGTKQQNVAVAVPTLTVSPPANEQATATNSAQ
jgi:energy-converting hydrogenase Eha subunit F